MNTLVDLLLFLVGAGALLYFVTGAMWKNHLF